MPACRYRPIGRVPSESNWQARWTILRGMKRYTATSILKEIPQNPMIGTTAVFRIRKVDRIKVVGYQA